MNAAGAQTQLTCFELSRPVASANTVFTRATSGKNTTSPHHPGLRVPTLTPALSGAVRYRKKNVTNQIQQNKPHREPPQGGRGYHKIFQKSRAAGRPSNLPINWKMFQISSF